MRPIRFTVRRLMVIVALAAVPLALFCWVRLALEEFSRRRERASRAYTHKDEAFTIWMFQLEPAQRELGGEGLWQPGGDSPDLNDSAVWKAILSRSPPEELTQLQCVTERHNYHKRMEAKWERAALRPWDPVAADPPPPKSQFLLQRTIRFTPYGSL